jgi:hypothetical protein
MDTGADEVPATKAGRIKLKIRTIKSRVDKRILLFCIVTSS